MDILILLLILGLAVLGYAQIRSVFVQNRMHRRVVRLERQFLQKELAKDDKQSAMDANNDYWQKIADFLNDNER